MSDLSRQTLTLFLLPITWVLLSLYVFRPLEKYADKHLPPRIAGALTRKRG